MELDEGVEDIQRNPGTGSGTKCLIRIFDRFRLNGVRRDNFFQVLLVPATW